MDPDLEAPRGWMEVQGDEPYPAFRTHVPRGSEGGVLSGYIRVMTRGAEFFDVIIEEREQEAPKRDWSPTYSGVIDISGHPDDLQDMLDTAADAWLTWAQNANEIIEP